VADPKSGYIQPYAKDIRNRDFFGKRSQILTFSFLDYAKAKLGLRTDINIIRGSSTQWPRFDYLFIKGYGVFVCMLRSLATFEANILLASQVFNNDSATLHSSHQGPKNVQPKFS
jgi:hypothetical protein